MNEGRYRWGSSMCRWWPRIEDLPVPMPRTEMVEVDIPMEGVYGTVDGETGWMGPYWEDLGAACDRIGYPCFLRTDQTSAKHDYRNTCHVGSSADLVEHVRELMTFSVLADVVGLPVYAFFVRELLPLAAQFKAFAGLPIAPERRYMMREHARSFFPYWPPEAFKDPDDEEWREKLRVMNTGSEEEEEVLGAYARVAYRRVRDLDDYWSVDFCLSEKGVWYLIDMALGKESWTPEDLSFTDYKGKDYHAPSE